MAFFDFSSSARTLPNGTVSAIFCGLPVFGFRLIVPVAVVWYTAPASVPSLETSSVYAAPALIAVLPSFRLMHSGAAGGRYDEFSEPRDITSVYPGGYPEWTLRAGLALRVDL